jgi:hypothetical protein
MDKSCWFIRVLHAATLLRKLGGKTSEELKAAGI